MASSKIAIFFCIVLATAASARRSENPKSICDSVNTDRALCKKLAGKAHTWPKAMTNMLVSIRGKVVAGKNIAYGVADKVSVSEGTATECKGAYDNVVENIDEHIESVKADPHVKLVLSYGAAAATYADCIEYLHEDNVKLPEVENLEKELLKLRDVLLAVNDLKH